MKSSLYFGTTVITSMLFMVILFDSCQQSNNNSQVYDTPFPLDEINAYFDIPCSQVTFVSNYGDTVMYDYDSGKTNYTPHVDVSSNEANGEHEEYYESYGIEVFSRTATCSYGMTSMYLYIYCRERQALIITSWTDIYENNHESFMYYYGLEYEMPQATNEVFTFLTDTITLPLSGRNCVIPYTPTMDHLTIVRGEGVIEYSRYTETEIWQKL